MNCNLLFAVGEKGHDVQIGTPKEILDGETRVAMTPESADRLQQLGYRCLIEKSAGVAAGYSDSDYEAAGVKVIANAVVLWEMSDMVAKVRQPIDVELEFLKKGKLLTSFFSDTGREEAIDRIKPMGASVIAMEMVLRIVGRDPAFCFA